MDLMAKDAYYQGAWRTSWRVVGSDSGRKPGANLGENPEGSVSFSKDGSFCAS